MEFFRGQRRFQRDAVLFIEPAGPTLQLVFASSGDEGNCNSIAESNSRCILEKKFLYYR